MTDRELDQILKSGQVSDRPDDYWDEFPLNLIRQLRQPSSSRLYESSRHPIQIWKWAIGLAAAGILIGFSVGFWSGRDPAPEKAELAAMRKVFHEISALFPHQIRAIVMDGQDSKLVLADQPNLPNAQPIYLEICAGSQCQRVITFSGEQIPINGETCEVLIDAQGNVMVVGDRWVWSRIPALAGPARYHIQAQTLEEIL